ncbi:MAG: dihydrodipicolinate synthase family protein [Victivallaceae bacterium]|nr:dihydrodipicolinate synthase family protein [Victivallaceae bacterium]
MKKVNQENVAGVWSAMPTPFTNELKLDTESVSCLMEHHVRLGIKGVLIAGISGEGHLMSDSMQTELAVEVVKSNQNRMLLSMMVMDSSAAMMIDNIKCIEDYGIDIAVIGFPFTPIDVEPEYLRELYLSVLEKSSLPVSINHINRFSSNLDETELFEELIMHPKVIQLNDCSNSSDKIDMVLDTKQKRENELTILSGNELCCASYVAFGYEGFLLGSACFTGFVAGKILELVQADKINDAWELQSYMNSLLIDVFGLDFEHYLIGQKQMMVELGIFSTAKTLQKHQIPEDFIFTIKELVKEEKEFLLPEIKPQSEE